MADSPELLYQPDIDALTRHAFGLIWNAYPGYSADVLPQDELMPSVRNNVMLAVEVLVRGTTPTHEELAEGRGLGARRASQGVPLESVIQAYRSTERTIILDLFSDARKWPVHLTAQYADLAISTFDLLTEECINAYRETASVMEAAQRRIENEIVTAVAAGYPIERPDLERWSQGLNIDVAAPYVAFALSPVGGADEFELHRLRRRLGVALQPHVSGPVVSGDIGGMVVVLLSPRGPADAAIGVLGSVLAGATPVDIVAGAGEIYPDLVRAHESCREAREAVAVALARRAAGEVGGATGDDGGSEPAARVVRYREVLIDALLLSRPKLARQLVSHRVDALRGHGHLLETLDALVANDLSQSRTAQQLYLHVNTVGHRIKRIRELTGFDPLRLEDLLGLALARRWQRLGGE